MAVKYMLIFITIILVQQKNIYINSTNTWKMYLSTTLNKKYFITSYSETKYVEICACGEITAK